MRTLMSGLAPKHRAGLLSGIYLFSYLGAAIPAFVAGELISTWGLSTVTPAYGGLIILLALTAVLIVTVTGNRTTPLVWPTPPQPPKKNRCHHESPSCPP
jgi:MFS family permease